MHFIWHQSSRITVGAEESLVAPLKAAIETQASFIISKSNGTTTVELLDNDSGEAVFYCQTSGTTAAPVGIKRQPKSWIESFNMNARTFSIDRNSRYAIFGSLGHSLGLYALLEALNFGADADLLYGTSLRKQLVRLRQYQSSVLYATPTHLKLLLSLVDESITIDSVQTILCGGGFLEPHSRNALKQLFPNADIVVFYGSSETSFISMSDHTTPSNSVGKAYPGVNIRIKTANKTDDFGEILVKSPYLFAGYADADKPQPNRIDGFQSTGDIGYLDDGNLYLLGRIDRMVRVAEVNVHLDKVEAVIQPIIPRRQCCVIALKDSLRQHRLIAFITGEQNDLDRTSIETTCRQQLVPQAVPYCIYFISALPLLPSGKPDVNALSELAKKRS